MSVDNTPSGAGTVRGTETLRAAGTVAGSAQGVWQDGAAGEREEARETAVECGRSGARGDVGERKPSSIARAN